MLYVIPPTASATIVTAATAIITDINSTATVPVAKSATATAVPNNAVALPAEILLLSVAASVVFLLLLSEASL